MENGIVPIARPATPRARYRTRGEWQEIYNTWRSSSQTQREFCEQHDITLGSFRRWSRHFRTANDDLTAVAPTRQPFVELTGTVHTEPAQAGWDIELELGQGVILRMRKPC